jgi:hypothetical protein
MMFSVFNTNFTAGVLSPRMFGRVDVARYNNGAKDITNAIPLIHGGVVRRPGTRFVKETKDSAKVSRLIPYVFSTSQAYQLEFGDGYIRFYNDSGENIESSPGVPYEITSPYTEAQLAEIDFCQGADTMFMFHPDVYPQRLQRFGDAVWRIQNAPFDPEPFDEIGVNPATTCTLSSAAVGSRTFTAGSSVFQPSDVGRDINSGAGQGTITGYTSGTQVTVNVTTAFASTSLASGAWTITSSPQTTCTPSAKDPVGASITLTLGSGGWRSDDVGKFVNINGGLCRITSYSSATVVNAEIRVELSATVAAEANAWYLAASMWGGANGYPRTGSLFQQRLFAAGSPGYPQSVWMSELGNPYSFEIGTDADAGFEVRLVSDQANPINSIASSRAVIVLTSGSEFTLGADNAITPTTVVSINQSAYGCNTLAPVRVGNELLFVSRSGRRIRAISADRFDPNTFAAPDITALAEHITAPAVVDMDSHADPESLVWCVRSDGVMLTCTLDRDNEVVAWAKHTTDGEFESVSVIPMGESFVAWCIVKRTINGATKRYVEYFDWTLKTDSAIIGTSGSPTDAWSGLTHLEAKTVNVLADGILQTDKTVATGAVTIDHEASDVEFGLSYVPTVTLLTPELQGPTGSIQGQLMRTYSVDILVKDTIGARVNDYDIAFQTFGPDVLDEAPPEATGFYRIENLGYVRGSAEVEISQPQALPFHLLSVVRRMDIGQNP